MCHGLLASRVLVAFARLDKPAVAQRRVFRQNLVRMRERRAPRHPAFLSLGGRVPRPQALRKTKQMTYRNRERVARILAHQEADRVPVCRRSPHPEVVELVDAMGLDADHRAFCLEGDFEFVTFDYTAERERFLPYLGDLRNPDAAIWFVWGIAQVPLQSVEGYHAGHRTYHPLAGVNTVAELNRYPWPDFTDPARHAHLETEIAAAKADGYTVVGQMSQTILETAYMMRGLEQMMCDFYERPDYVDTLFTKLGRRRVFEARRLAEAGADVIRIGDDIATQKGLMVGRDLYRRFIRPWHADAVAAAREFNPDVHILYHSDGNLTALLPDLIEIGVTAINPVQPECMDLARIKREFGRDLTLWGCCPVQSIYAHGSREDVIRHNRSLMKEIAPGGGLVLEFTNMILTPSVLDNLRTFFETFYGMGRYDRP